MCCCVFVSVLNSKIVLTVLILMTTFLVDAYFWSNVARGNPHPLNCLPCGVWNKVILSVVTILHTILPLYLWR